MGTPLVPLRQTTYTNTCTYTIYIYKYTDIVYTYSYMSYSIMTY